MNISVREMQLEEVETVIDYFHNVTPEHLELLGVDPTRLPSKVQWKQFYEYDYSQPRERRKSLMLLWQVESKAIGFSSVDKIKYGEEASCTSTYLIHAVERQATVQCACVSR
jgi:hypothetical protein